MTRRRALLVFVAAATLLVALNALVWSLYRSEVRTVNGTLADRLNALGHTSATSLATGGDPGSLAAALVTENHLEDAYVIDSGLHVIAGAHTPAGAPLNLLRVDQDRLTAALDGTSSVGAGYSVANAEVEAAYFPFERAGARYVLALEAGAEYHAPAARLRTTYLIAVALSILVAGVFGLGLVLALRSLERARVAHGRAERLAAVGQMAAMIAHEVRNPLGILRGQVELARERLAADAPPREHERFAEMLGEIERLNRLTEEFLGLARDQPLETAPVELGALATALAADVRIASPAAKLDVHATTIEVEGDAGKLRQAMHNLVLNALQIGGDAVTVRIDVIAEGAGATIRVSDDGPGIPADLAPRLFDPFVSKRTGGSGLGLAIARRVAERHGGTLELVSTPGQPGAAFSIYLPRHH
jgi:two-component system OmpR family sensor kinase